ncbi:MAG TPA: TadE/TadG family type IV pilus assembly protein [Thermomicrobiales bacterium]|nr:TadE/TadG family type IV pilus assembly protein [Thermomicrobiales bacterium]
MAGKETAVMEPEGRATTHGGRRRWARSGQSLVELALLLPMFTLILLGAVDLGRAFFYYNRMTAAVEQGGLFGIRYPTYMTSADSANPNNIKYVVTNEYPGMISTDDVTITCYTRATPPASYNCGATDPGTGRALVQPGDTIVVKATYNFKPITGQILRFLGSNYTMSKTVKMVIL